MFTHLSEFRKSLMFYAIVFSLVTAVSQLPLGAAVMLPLAMLMPAVAVLLMLLVVTRDGYSRGGWQSLGFTVSESKGGHWPWWLR